jgi:hypothetical protein
VYTFAENLLKENDMEAGAVSFKKSKEKRYLKHVPKEKDVLNVIRKTKIEEFPDLQTLYQNKMADLKKEEQLKKTQEKIEEKKLEIDAKQEIKKQKEAKKEKEKQLQEFFDNRDEEEKRNKDNEDLLDEFW